MMIQDYEIKPQIRISETQTVGLNDKNVGNRVSAILNFEVVEKTKSFTVLRINHIYIVPTKTVG